MKRVLITGASGFAGSFLAQFLSEKKDLQLFGTYLLDESKQNLSSVKNIELRKVNLINEEEVSNLIDEIKPDFIYHLAALSSPSDSFLKPKETFINNVSSEINILESVRKSQAEAKILIISSAEIYGKVDKNNLPISEEIPFNPTNSYAVSKLAQDFLGLQYFNTYQLGVVRVRPFNHIGPRQSEKFVVSAFAKKIAEIEKGKRENILTVGSLEAKRDFTDVRDMVKAYVLALEKGEPGEVYNIGRNKSYKISYILEFLLSQSKVKIEVKEDFSLFRPADNPELLCDSSKFKSKTGWIPEIKIEDSLKDTLDYWREII